MKQKFLIACFFVTSLLTAAVQAPFLSGPVVDEASLLTGSERSRLERLLIELKNSEKTEMVVLIIPTLGEIDIESYSVQVMEQWQLGKKKKDEGLLLVIAVRDRKMRLETGYGMEGEIPDAIAKRLLDEDLRPFFRQQRFADGIEVVVRKVGAILKVDLTGDSPKSRLGTRTLISSNLVFLFFSIFVLFILLPFLVRHSGGGGGGGYWGGGGYGGGGGSGWSGGGGGSWGGGGGSSGGGGASSSW